jgi:uncharacterized membrane protein
MTASSRPLALILGVLALVGLGIAVYLTVVHYSDAPLACTQGGVVDCAQVTKSAFSVVPGTDVPVTVPGMLFFLASGVLVALTLVWRSSWLLAAHVLLGLAGIGAVAYLLYAELVVIHRICEWCTAVHVVIVLSFLLALRRWQEQAAADA